MAVVGGRDESVSSGLPRVVRRLYCYRSTVCYVVVVVVVNRRRTHFFLLLSRWIVQWMLLVWCFSVLRVSFLVFLVFCVFLVFFLGFEDFMRVGVLSGGS